MDDSGFSLRSSTRLIVRPISRVKSFIADDVWEIDTRELPTWQKAAVALVRLVSVAIRGFVENKCRLRAAALTYATVFSLIPFLALAFAMAGAFKGPIQDKIKELQTKAIEKLAPEGQGVFEDAVTQVNSFIENFNNVSLGAVGAIVLIFSVVSLLSHIEAALNETWGVRNKRPLFMRILVYWSLVTLGTIILAASLSLSAVPSQVGIVKRVLTIGPVAKFVSVVTPYFVTSLFLCFVYNFMPNTRIRFRPSLVGGIVGGVLWEVSKNLYVFYVSQMLQNADVYVKVYSGMAAVPLFLLWMYVSWIIFLLGAEVAFAVQNTETYRLDRKAKGISHHFKELVSLRVMLIVSRYFLSGKTGLGAEALAKEIQAPLRLVNDVTFDLCQAGLLVETAVPEGCFAPAVPLDRLTPHGVFSKLRGLGRTPRFSDEPTELGLALGLMEKGDAASEEALKASDIQSLAEELMRQNPEA